mgnify:CR=1 FL=1
MKRTKGFAYDTETDKDVIEHIEKQPIQNKYIWDLVRSDMNKSDDNIEELVKKYVEKILKGKNLEVNSKSKIELDNVMDLLNIGK